ncbi:MAG: hypothetical protein ACOWWM_14815 [Desulfobacterales bacterium]
MKKAISVVLSVMFLAVALYGVAAAADEMTITGTVNAENQIVDESGQAFSLADTEEGLEVKALVGKKVQVTGTVAEQEGQKVLTVMDYEIME